MRNSLSLTEAHVRLEKLPVGPGSYLLLQP